jgi:hypothetical protein
MVRRQENTLTQQPAVIPPEAKRKASVSGVLQNSAHRSPGEKTEASAETAIQRTFNVQTKRSMFQVFRKTELILKNKGSALSRQFPVKNVCLGPQGTHTKNQDQQYEKFIHVLGFFACS